MHDGKTEYHQRFDIFSIKGALRPVDAPWAHQRHCRDAHPRAQRDVQAYRRLPLHVRDEQQQSYKGMILNIFKQTIDKVDKQIKCLNKAYKKLHEIYQTNSTLAHNTQLSK